MFKHNKKLLALLMVMVFAMAALIVPVQVSAQGEDAAAPVPEEQRAADLLEQVIKYIKTVFINEVDIKELTRGAIRGMMESLDDRYSDYFEKEDYDEFNLEVVGTYGGVGLVIGMRDNFVTVVSPIAGGPGDVAGIKPGDKIVRVDGKDVTKNTQADVAKLLRGDEGTKVTISISRDGEPKVLDFSLSREIIHLNPIESKVLEDGIGYIRINDFNENTKSNMDKTMDEFKTKGVKGIILDVRNNPGGLLDQAVEAADLFLDGGDVVKLVTRQGEVTTYKAKSGAYAGPVVMLVNGGSASASEILAGAMQDHGRATLVGTTTFGKAMVQRPVDLGSFGGFKITIGKYITPAGKDINEKGIEPDVVIDSLELKPSHDEFAPLGDKRSLSRGIIGLDVYGIQQRLAYLGYFKVEPNGIFGPKTAQAVADFQQAAGLSVKSSVDNATYAAIEKAITEKEQQEMQKDVQMDKAIEILKGKL
jgi:carboxyl-terminal processing protease